MSSIIRTSKHTLSHTNLNKRLEIKDFIASYREAVEKYVDYLWNSPVSYAHKETTKTFNVSNLLLDCPSYIDYKVVSFPTKLSARALSSAATQACGIIKSATEKRRKQLYKLEQLKKESKNTKRLEEKIAKFPLVKPSVPEDFKVEVSSKCAVLQEGEKEYFDCWLRLQYLGGFPNIYVPIKNTKHSNRLRSRGFSLMGSFLIYEDNIDIRWSKEIKPVEEGKRVGCDPGVTDILTFSDDGIKAPQHPHGHTYKSILTRLSRKKRGSNGFKRVSDLRKNFINWYIKRVPLNGIKELCLEDNGYLHYKNNSSRLLYHNSWSLIKDKLSQELSERGVLLKIVPNVYRSQRCHCCGWVHKDNRKKKDFYCSKCGNYDDSDKNSSKNQLEELPYIPVSSIDKKLNRTGFYWLSSGVFSDSGQEMFLGVPGTLKSKDFI